MPMFIVECRSRCDIEQIARTTVEAETEAEAIEEAKARNFDGRLEWHDDVCDCEPTRYAIAD